MDAPPPGQVEAGEEGAHAVVRVGALGRGGAAGGEVAPGGEARDGILEDALLRRGGGDGGARGDGEGEGEGEAHRRYGIIGNERRRTRRGARGAECLAQELMYNE